MSVAERHALLWGWTLEEWSNHGKERFDAINMSPRFVGVEFERLPLSNIGHVVRESDGLLIADFGDGPEMRLADAMVPDASTPWGLAETRQALCRRQIRALVESGVHVVAIDAVWVDATVTVAPGAELGPGVSLCGSTTVGAGAVVMTGCHVTNTRIGEGAVLKPHTVADGASIGPGAAVGPSAHLRTGADLREDVKVGNFVEVKKSVLHAGSKASHLTYIGDAEVGPGANIGAGTITCNYDGYGKHKTTIGAGAFVGSNSSLVAPVTIGKGAIVGAGSVITQDVPDDALTVERTTQRTLEGRASRIRASNARRAGKTP
jgi:bifunctional UDP-N-acetylglucosamine pyrophosphorylase/glucosamine-1-phosphate N-acetyltransferase